MRVRPTGPVPCDVLLVGEAPGEKEDQIGLPFVGAAGDELNRMLAQSGLSELRIRKTNVFMDRPTNNRIESFCAKRADVGKDYVLPPLSTGNYVRPDKLFELERLDNDIREADPKLIVPLGNVACWAILKRTGIGKLRGSVFSQMLAGRERAVLPSYHPAAILRDWSLRTITVADFIKAHRFVTVGFSPPKRELWLEPSLEEVELFFNRYIYGVGDGAPLPHPDPFVLSFDIEAIGSHVTCIGFAPSPERAITVPFYHTGKPGRNYWPSAEDELRAFKLVKALLESDIPKLGQNGLYDIQQLHGFGIRVRAYRHDLMIRHHAMQPELQKGLAFLASIYSDEVNWKMQRPRRKDMFKQEDE